MDITVIETGGKQYIVSPGQKLKVEKLNHEVGGDFVFDKVLLLAKDGKVQIGKPYLEKAGVKARILENGRGKKVIVFRYHSKTRYRKKKGHRQPYTEVEIIDIK